VFCKGLHDVQEEREEGSAPERRQDGDGAPPGAETFWKGKAERQTARDRSTLAATHLGPSQVAVRQ
jgi:hypothetical protein